MFDMLAMAVAALALWAIWKESVPTGILGSLGLLIIGCAAAVAADDTSFGNLERVRAIVVALLIGFLLLATHVVLLVVRARTGAMTMRRRATDLARPSSRATSRAR